MRLQPTALTLMTIMLAACGSGNKSSGSGSGSSTATPVPTAHDLVIVPAIGYVDKANVTVKKLDGTAIATKVTVDGQTTVTVPAGIDAVVIEVTGGADSKYFEESANAMQDFPATSTLRAMTLVSHDKQMVAVTPLTEMAVSLAMGTMGGVHKFSIVQSNDYISGYFDVDNILTPPLRIDSLTDYGNLAIDTQAKRNASKYALFLTSISKYSATRSGPVNASLRLAKELSEDLADDGIVNNAAAATYLAGNIANGLKTALAHFKTDMLDANGIVLPSNLLNESLNIEPYYIGLIFKINGRINSSEYETNPGPGIDTTGFSVPRITTNITAGDLTGLTGAFNGKNLIGKDCKVVVGNDGVITLSESGVTVATHKLDGGNEDSRMQTFNSSGSLLSQYIQARSAADSTKSLFLGYGASSGLLIAGETDNVKNETTGMTTNSITIGCYISAP